MTGYLYDRLAAFAIEPAQTLTAGLRRLGYAPADVRSAVLSHLHQDHIGGLAELRSADIVVAEEEWRGMLKPFSAQRGFLRSHIELPGLRWRRINPEPITDRVLAPFRSGHDLFGDGTSSCCRRRGIRRDRSRCWCAAPAGHRCSWSATSRTTTFAARRQAARCGQQERHAGECGGERAPGALPGPGRPAGARPERRPACAGGVKWKH